MVVISLLGTVSLYLRATLVFFSDFLLDVLQEGCPGIHHRFEGIFTTRRHALVGVKQHSELPIGFVDFIPTRKKPSSMSATGSAPAHGSLVSGLTSYLLHYYLFSKVELKDSETNNKQVNNMLQTSRERNIMWSIETPRKCLVKEGSTERSLAESRHPANLHCLKQ